MFCPGQDPSKEGPGYCNGDCSWVNGCCNDKGIVWNYLASGRFWKSVKEGEKGDFVGYCLLFICIEIGSVHKYTIHWGGEGVTKSLQKLSGG